MLHVHAQQLQQSSSTGTCNAAAIEGEDGEHTMLHVHATPLQQRVTSSPGICSAAGPEGNEGDHNMQQLEHSNQ
jgi:hypothetical protein